ncbi:hypothetical protein AURDEDRAFT_179686 [Auricularia subglabra TFB-10046 SS5]|nr:hypothetical protein AURDEDRAFT_179686 [Auricularia subglabra TFB-10046 SS5]
MKQHSNIVPFLLGACVSFVLYSLAVLAPSQASRLSFSNLLPKSASATAVGAAPLSPLSSFQHAWSLVRPPVPAPRPYASDPKRVCVMAADTRPLKEFSPATVDPAKLDFRTFATYYTLWWSLRHGYTYRMVRTQQPKGYDPIWSKTRAIRDMVANPDCELVVFFDSDAYVTQPSYSIDDLLYRWGFHERAVMLLAMDQPVHSMPQNQNATNTGFMVFRTSQKALDILDAIMECPEKIAECAEWKNVPKYEQTAFNHHVRPHLKEGDELIIVPCTEANGNFMNRYCKGEFITHAWHALDTVVEKASAIMLHETFAWLATVFDGERIVDRITAPEPPASTNPPATGKRAQHSRRHHLA